MNKWTLGKEIGVPIAREFDVTIFFKDVPKVPKSIPRLETTPFTSQESPKYQIDYGKGYRGFGSPRIECTKLSLGYTLGSNVCSNV